jgi:hypothetical protein
MYINCNFFATANVETNGAISPIPEIEPQIYLNGKNEVVLNIMGEETTPVVKEFLENEEMGFGFNKLDFFSKNLLVKAIKEKAICMQRIAYTSKIKRTPGYVIEVVVDTNSSRELETMYNNEVQIRSELYYA